MNEDSGALQHTVAATTREKLLSSAEITAPWSDGAYSIKQHGVQISNCDEEPVQTPGCIQGHGALVVVSLRLWAILQVSENALQMLGLPSHLLLGTDIRTLLGSQCAARLKEFVRDEPVSENPLYFDTMQLVAPVVLDISVHVVDDLVMLEFEPSNGPERAPDYYGIVKKSMVRLQSAQGVSDFCTRACEEIRQLSGLDRVMTYRFHEDGSGEVIAESKRADLDPYLGLHYPAHDIPKPAREIFKQIWIRPLPDANADVVEMVPLLNPETGRALNMRFCSLRGASIMYREYLQNMGVAASSRFQCDMTVRLLGADRRSPRNSEGHLVASACGVRTPGANCLAAACARRRERTLELSRAHPGDASGGIGAYCRRRSTVASHRYVAITTWWHRCRRSGSAAARRMVHQLGARRA